jgi:hypothetical protein
MPLKAMRAFILILLFLVPGANYLMAGDEVAFKHHNLEFSFTPAVDYHFVTWPGRPPANQRTDFTYHPFIGFNFGIAYVYRPIKWIGISGGINNLEYGLKISDPYIKAHKGFEFDGYLGIPLLLHAYEQIKNTVLEFSTGPEFLLPLFSSVHYTSSTSGDRIRTYGGLDIQGNTTLAWDLQLTATIPVRRNFELAIGPEMKFLDICQVPRSPFYNQTSHDIDSYIGVKIGFRIGSNFFKKRNDSQLYKASLY